MLPVIINCGDPNGIGPEVTLRALQALPTSQRSRAVLIGSFRQLQEINAILGEPLALQWVKSITGVDFGCGIPVLEPEGAADFSPRYGEISATSGAITGRGIILGAQACLQGEASALVTAPSCKESLHLAGFRYPGQTEMIAELTGASDHIMILAANHLRVGMATTHLAIREVSHSLNVELIQRKIRVLCATLIGWFGEKKPRIAVCALNPHASDGGIFGDEENNIIRPAIEAERKNGILVEGPFPADTLFLRYRNFDGILAMYHDQGMIPIKMAGFGRAVNLTGGLPFPRTSPDHGTAFDIAGKYVANHGSMGKAIKMAFRLSHKHGKNRNK